MQVLTKDDLTKGFEPYSKLGKEYVHFDDSKPYYADPESACIVLEYPQKLEQLPFFARYLATIGYDDWDFRGALLWLTDWGVWQALDEGPGYRIIESMNRASGQPVSFEAGTGHQFRADELSDAVGMLMQPMIFGWDAYYLPQWSYGTGEFFLHVSHDSYVTLVTRTRAFYDRVFPALQKLDFNPKPGQDLHTERFCRGK